MNVLIVSQYFWPESFRINDLALGLQERGHRVTVLTGMPNYPQGHYYPGYGAFGPFRQDYSGITVYRVPLAPRGTGGALRLTLNYASFAMCASVLGPLLCRGRYDLVFVFEPSPITVGLPAIVLKILKSARLVFWVQDLWPESLQAAGSIRSRTILGSVERLVRLIYRACDLILVQSRAFVPNIEKLGVDTRKIRYFPNSAESFYRPVSADETTATGVPLPTGLRIMFAGNIGAAQSFPTILDAAERLKCNPEIQWLIVGDGRMRPWVESEIRRRGLEPSVHLLGRYAPEFMPALLSLADALLVTLTRSPIFALTIPSKVQSCLACGKPVIAAVDGEGARIIEEAGAGLTCPSEDAAGLAKAVLSFAEKPACEREAMGWRGRQYFDRNFQRDLLLDQLDGWMAMLAKPSHTQSTPGEPSSTRST